MAEEQCVKPEKPKADFAKAMERWKTRYGCSLGDTGWCDGHNAKRCPQVIVLRHSSDGCQLSL